jgi:outer membrane protein assembly factor BamB
LNRFVFASVTFALLGVACGRTDVELWAIGTSGAGAMAGAPTSATGGAPAAGTGGTTSSGPDFDFTPVPDQATAYQVHPSHSGSQQSVTITPPLTRIWAQHFDAAVSYPVMVDGRVFVSLDPALGGSEAIVSALDAASGTVLWSSQPIRALAPVSRVTLAYDRGVLFAANEDGDVLAFDPERGNVRWRIRLAGTTGFGRLPIAAGGAVMFVGAVGFEQYALSVIDERDGSLVYTVALPVGGDPTLGNGRIYVGGDCDAGVAINAASGALDWQTAEKCGGTRRTVIHDGVLWLSSSTDVIRAVDPASGSVTGTLEDDYPSYMPSAAEDQLVLPTFVFPPLVPQNAVRVFGATAGVFRWQVPLPARPVLPALATPDTVYVLGGTDDKFLYGVDLVTRQFSWQSSEPAARAESPPLTDLQFSQGLAASGGRVVVAYGGWLSAFAAAN